MTAPGKKAAFRAEHSTALRADQIGSLLRPQALLAARQAFAAGHLALEQLQAAEDQAILAALEMQRRSGIDVLSDGEFRRTSFLGGLLDKLRGLARSDEPAAAALKPVWRGIGETVASADAAVPSLRVAARLSVAERFTAVEAGFLKRHAGRPFKVALPSPHMLMHLHQSGVTDAVYASRQEMLDDLVEICRSEVEGLVSDGVPYVQLDSLRYTDLIDEQRRQKWQKLGFDRVLGETITADNAVLHAARRAGVIRGVHMCRGNHRSAWAGTGGYEAVAERLFNELDTDRFLLEFDDARSGGFEPLRFVPKGKTIVLGLITTKTGTLESVDALRQRIDEASKYVPLESLAISPQCGFASTHMGNLLSEAEEARKLELVAQTARLVWG